MLCDSFSRKAHQSERKIGRGWIEDEVRRLSTRAVGGGDRGFMDVEPPPRPQCGFCLRVAGRGCQEASAYWEEGVKSWD